MKLPIQGIELLKVMAPLSGVFLASINRNQNSCTAGKIIIGVQKETILRR
jgi:hypothetical protein